MAVSNKTKTEITFSYIFLATLLFFETGYTELQLYVTCNYSEEKQIHVT